MNKPLCLVIIPFGEKQDSHGRSIDFDYVYHDFIKQAIDSASLEPFRADTMITEGVIHKRMYERLILCEYAIIDVSILKADAYYQLGVRHALKPNHTVAIYHEKMDHTIENYPFHKFSYQYKKGQIDGLKTKIDGLVTLINSTRRSEENDPLIYLMNGIPNSPEVAHSKTDDFHGKVSYSDHLKQQLEYARGKGDAKQKKKELEEIVAKLGDLSNLEVGFMIDVMLFYRDLSDYESMIKWIEKLPLYVANSLMVQEQYAFALNRINQPEKALEMLKGLIKIYGPSSETYGIMGRVYKEQYQLAKLESDEPKARQYLDLSIETYINGFEADWRDAYPGINAASLLVIKDKSDPRITEILPAVKYAVNRKIARGNLDYWDYATLLELAVIESSKKEAKDALKQAFTMKATPWMHETTLNNILIITKAREAQGEAPTNWINQIIKSLS